LAFRTLAYCRDGKAVEFNFSVIAFLDEEHLPAAASHFGRFGIKPTRTRGVTRARFFELAGDFPRGFIFWFVRSSQRHSMDEEGPNECT
jgi:hypothetical protein